MGTQIIKTTIQLRRGTAAKWAEVNPILGQGEPGYVYDSNLLKIGDGITPWNDLPYIQGNSEILSYDKVDIFPNQGDPTIIYKASKELSLYQFNPDTNIYEKLSDGTGIDNIELINGGKA